MKTIEDIMIENNATNEREVEYLRESVIDDKLDNFSGKADLDKTPDMADIIDEYKDAKDIIDKMPEGDEFKEAEINRIIRVAESMTFDEMIGINE